MALEEIGWNQHVVGTRRVVKLRSAKLPPALIQKEENPSHRRQFLLLVFAWNERSWRRGAGRALDVLPFTGRPAVVVGTPVHGAILQDASSDGSFQEE